jgi:hypothetical protein
MKESARMAGYPDPVRGAIGNMSDFRPGSIIAGTSTPSYHGAGRALDIGKFLFQDSRGRNYEIMAHVKTYRRGGAPKKFYDQFRRCWAGNLPDSCRGRTVGSIGCDGSEGYTDGDHFNHIHIELANKCGGSR